MSNRSLRRASAAVFRKETKRRVNSYLVSVEDVAFLELEAPMLWRAIASFNDGTERICIGYRDTLADKVIGAYLQATPTTSAPAAASISAYCQECRETLPAAKLEACAARLEELRAEWAKRYPKQYARIVAAEKEQQANEHPG